MVERSHEASVSAQFSPQAEAYVASPVHAQGDDLALLAEIVSARPAGSALDLGCGGGHTSFVLARTMQSVVAYDLSDAMLAAVRSEADRRGLGNLTVRQGRAERLPFPEAAFDIVATRYSAHHWSDVPAGLSKARRVLKPDGIMVVMDAIAPERPLLDTWLQALELMRDSSHVRDYSLANWKVMLEETGFSIDTTIQFRLRLDFSSWIKRINTPEIQAEAIRALQARAADEVVRHFEIGPDGSFTIDIVLIGARR